MSKRPRDPECASQPQSLPREIIPSLLLHSSGYRGLLLVCRDWHAAIVGSRPDWTCLLREPLQQVLGADRVATLASRPHAYRCDLALLCDSVARQALYEPALGAQCVQLVQQYYDECQPLGITHHHRKDMRITFREQGHCYTVLSFERTRYVLRTNDPQSAQPWPSATGWLATLFKPFVTEERARACLASPRWQSDPTYKYYQKSYEEIVAIWAQASVYGTNRHGNMELCLNELPHDTSGPEWRLWLRYRAQHITGKLLPWRSEQKLWSERLAMVGSDDITWIYADPAQRYTPDGRLRLVLQDFKFCEDVRHSSYEQEGGIVPVTAKAPDCNATKWAIQLHLYKVMLEEYGYAVEPLMTDIVLHPSQKDYIKEDFQYDAAFSRKLVAHRLSQVAKMRCA